MNRRLVAATAAAGLRAAHVACAALVVMSAAVGAPQRGPAPADPCRLVDKTDASRLLHAPIVAMKLATMGSSRTCTMRTANLLRSVVVSTFRWSSPPEAHARFAELVAQASRRTRTSPALKVAGLGDEAASIASNVYVRKGTGAFVFDVIDGTVGPARTARTVALAHKSLARVR